MSPSSTATLITQFLGRGAGPLQNYSGCSDDSDANGLAACGVGHARMSAAQDTACSRLRACTSEENSHDTIREWDLIAPASLPVSPQIGTDGGKITSESQHIFKWKELPSVDIRYHSSRSAGQKSVDGFRREELPPRKQLRVCRPKPRSLSEIVLACTSLYCNNSSSMQNRDGQQESD